MAARSTFSRRRSVRACGLGIRFGAGSGEAGSGEEGVSVMVGRVARRRSAQVLDRVVDAADELAHIVGLDRDERRDAQLVASELAVGLGVDDAVSEETLGDG